MLGIQRLLVIARMGVGAKSYESIRPAIVRLAKEVSRKSEYDKLRYPNPESVIVLSKALKKIMQAETERSIAICAIALKRYEAQHGNPAPSLDSLVPQFIESVPIDYMDGKPMKYGIQPDQRFRLYSVGDDGEDNGGDATLMTEKVNSRNLWDRKDFVWPAVALPEEIAADLR